MGNSGGVADQSFLDQLNSESTLAELPLHSSTVQPHTRTRLIADHFEKHSELPGVMVIDGDVLAGVLPREWFYQQLSKPLALDVYMNKPVSLLLATMRSKPLELDSMLGVQEAAHLALLRSRESFNELIVVRFEDDQSQLLGIHDLLRAQAKLLELANSIILEQKASADSANKTKSLFLANMSHEIRTPLNGIIGMSRLVLDSKLNSQQREYMDMVWHSADSLLHVINDVLDFSKVEAGKLNIENIPVTIRDVIEDCMKPLAFRAHGKNLELNYRVARLVPEVVKSDPIRISQILTNLVGNAIKFTSKGEILINIECIPQKDNKADLLFSVSDSGIGIPADRIHSIFDAFEQADGSTTREFGGTGLGLSISARLVGLLGGNIWVESTVNEGSTFHFTCQMEVPRQEVPAPHHKTLDMRALLVETNTTARNIVSEMLSHKGAYVDAVDNSESALELLQIATQANHPYDVLLLGNTRDSVNHPELVASMRMLAANHPTKIILLSQANSLFLDGSIKGVDAIIAKPVSEKALIQTLANHQSSSAEPLTGDGQLDQKSIDPKDKLNILLAEDNIVNQKLAVQLLKKSGHEATVVGDGKSAIDEYQEKEYDLVLMDIQMPIMDGWEATENIRELENRSGKHIPIIALTAHAIDGDREKCLNAGMDGYLPKPFKFDSFTHEISRVINASRNHSSHANH